MKDAERLSVELIDRLNPHTVAASATHFLNNLNGLRLPPVTLWRAFRPRRPPHVPLPNFLAALKSFPEEFQRIAHGTCYAMAGFSDRGGPSLPMISSVDTCAPVNIVVPDRRVGVVYPWSP
jgi:hypothetical protein